MPDWVKNDAKYQRAVKALGKDATEDAVKAEYIKYGGLVIGDPSTVRGGEISNPLVAAIANGSLEVEDKKPEAKKHKV